MHHRDINILIRVSLPATTHTACLTLTTDFKGAVQDLGHWNDVAKPRVHNIVKKGARGDAACRIFNAVQDFLHPQ